MQPNPCKQPDPLPTVEPSSSEQKRFHRDLESYKNCVQSYVDVESKLARAHADAAHKAIEEFNVYIKDANERYGTESQ